MGLEDCSLCFGANDSPDHLMLKCPFASLVVCKTCNWCGWVKDMGVPIREWLDRSNNLVSSEEMRDTTALIAMTTVWFLWLARNDFIYSSIPLSANGVVEKIVVNFFLWLKYRSNMVDIVWHKWYHCPWP